ncbi:TVP38/TMEM64 family protein [Brachybacterium sp. AOP43-C2-M15]|uniref:TVP38/TMEM64 family protein n=1 Tax=Brachybacterium sp. AOP43-C2-M15 TaxID=3457661 RepID=UPI0040349C6C
MSTATSELPLLPSAVAEPAPTLRRAARPAPADSPARPSAAASSAHPRRDPLRTAARLSPLLGLLVSVGLVWWGIESGVLSSLESLRAYITSLGPWGPIAFTVLTIALVVFPVIPGGLTVIAAPVMFGAVEGIALAYVAVCIGLLLNFTIGRHVGLGVLERMFSPRTIDKYLGWTRGPRFTRTFAAVITVPIAPDDLLGYLAGTTKMRWRTYAAIVLLCKPWSLMLYGLGVSALLLRILPW